MVSDRAYVRDNMPQLPEGYYFKVTRPFLGYQEVQLKRKRRWWFGGKTLADRTHYAGYLINRERVVETMWQIMSIHGGNEALAADRDPNKTRLTGNYNRVTPLHSLTQQMEGLTVGDGIQYDEVTETFTLSEEIIERLKNGG